MVKFLAAKGADPHHADADGVTALWIAAQQNQCSIVRFLAKHCGKQHTVIRHSLTAKPQLNV